MNPKKKEKVKRSENKMLPQEKRKKEDNVIARMKDKAEKCVKKEPIAQGIKRKLNLNYNTKKKRYIKAVSEPVFTIKEKTKQPKISQ